MIILKEGTRTQMRKLRSLSVFMFGLTIISLSAMAQQTTALNEWTWMGGSSTLGSNTGAPGVYGTLGIPASGNVPGSRSGASSWTDKSGNLWLFGGLGYDSNGVSGDLNDLWEFNSSTNEWAWMGGSSLISSGNGGFGQPGVYGTLGTPAAGNIPGSRDSAVSWTDNSGDLWLLGGYDGDGATGYMYNDLWKFNPSTNEWAWMGGSSTATCDAHGQALCGLPGLYGTLGTPASSNLPGSRESAVSWTDSGGNLWLFGGYGCVASGCGSFNDVWEFNPSANEWTWMSGSNTVSSPGSYGTPGTPNAGNTPGARQGTSRWTDSDGHLWIFGGNGYDSNGNSGYLNDLWEFNPSTNEWAWMGGSNTIANLNGAFCGQSGAYGTLGTPASGNLPGSRGSAANWTDNGGNFWLFGGTSCIPGFGNADFLNDLWEFSPSMNQWTWMGGSSTSGSGAQGPPGVYGTLGTPAAGNLPGSRYSATGWTDSSGHFWLFGGGGYDANGYWNTLNDVWEYQPPPEAATPVFSVPAGTYNTTQTVTISDSSSGATIYYTLDNSTPTISSTHYTGAITVSASETIQAIAVASGYAASTVATASYTIPPDFSVAGSPASLTVTGGQSGTAIVSVTPLYGFNSAVSFTCSGLPAGASCSFAPQTVTPSGGVASTTLTVKTATTTAALPRNSNPLLPGSALALALCCFGWRKRRRLQIFLLLAVSVAGLSIFTGCNAASSSTPQPVTSTVTVTATAGSVQHTSTISLTVN